jgi:hypothetical protein
MSCSTAHQISTSLTGWFGSVGGSRDRPKPAKTGQKQSAKKLYHMSGVTWKTVIRRPIHVLQVENYREK